MAVEKPERDSSSVNDKFLNSIMTKITTKELLDAGVHFGHLTRKWNPQMAPFIFMEKNGIHIGLLDTRRYLTLFHYDVEVATDDTVVRAFVIKCIKSFSKTLFAPLHNILVLGFS